MLLSGHEGTIFPSGWERQTPLPAPPTVGELCQKCDGVSRCERRCTRESTSRNDRSGKWQRTSVVIRRRLSITYRNKASNRNFEPFEPKVFTPSWCFYPSCGP